MLCVKLLSAADKVRPVVCITATWRIEGRTESAAGQRWRGDADDGKSCAGQTIGDGDADDGKSCSASAWCLLWRLLVAQVALALLAGVLSSSSSSKPSSSSNLAAVSAFQGHRCRPALCRKHGSEHCDERNNEE